VVSGINIIMEILGIENVLIGIEDNKPEAIKEMTRVAATDDRINVISLNPGIRRVLRKCSFMQLREGRFRPENCLRMWSNCYERKQCVFYIGVSRPECPL